MRKRTIALSDYVSMKWQTFHYNFRWPHYVWLLDGWISRLAVAIPIVGYLILFNDSVSVYLTFNSLASENLSTFGLSSSARLKCIYMGLLFLGTANILYRLFRPFIMRLGANESQYIKSALQQFIAYDYIKLNDEIRLHGHTTLYGKYDDSEWDQFLKIAHGSENGRNYMQGIINNANWGDAKKKYESLLRSILIDTYARKVKQRRGRLIICITISMAGYSLLFIPSADLFIKVMVVIFKPLF